MNTESLRVPLDGGVTMQLRPSELEAVASGLGRFAKGDYLTLVTALNALAASDRASFWELAVRRYARGKPLEQAAGEIGMDAVRGRALLEAFSKALAAGPQPETTSNR